MNKHYRNLLYGFLAWLIPFGISIFFYSRKGELVIDIFLFKTIMILVGAISGAFLLVSYFKTIDAGYVREGLYVGVTWFTINILLDVLVLIPMSGMSFAEYIFGIGLRYLVIPVMSIMLGCVLSNDETLTQNTTVK